MICKRKFPGTEIETSVFGMGCMRLPTLDAENRPVDHPEAVKLIRSAVDQGVTYIDTAYGYHGGDSEVTVGEALSGGYRERVTLTTKLPVWMVKAREDMEKLLDEQLARLQTDHVDFYLLHALNGKEYDRVKALGALEFLDEMVKKGKIRYPGFSFHDDAEAFRRILTDYPWKLTQVQMNILDEHKQATMDGVALAGELGIGVVVMEPLRGGSLAGETPDNVSALYDAAPVKRTAVEWAFRYLYDRPEVITILSGVSSQAQLDDNVRIFQNAEPNVLAPWERALLSDVRAAYESRVKIGCTGCEYCMPCPSGVKIPQIFRVYDECAMFNTPARFDRHYARLQAEGAAADKCVQCGKCEKACPQHIEIRKRLAEIRR